MLRHKRILEQLTVNDLLESFATNLTVKGEFEELKMVGTVYVFNRNQIDALIDQVVEFTYHETFNLIKRKVSADD
jgi:hypothetical protein